MGKVLGRCFVCFEFTLEYTFVKSCHFIIITFCLSLFKRQEIFKVEIRFVKETVWPFVRFYAGI